MSVRRLSGNGNKLIKELEGDSVYRLECYQVSWTVTIGIPINSSRIRMCSTKNHDGRERVDGDSIKLIKHTDCAYIMYERDILRCTGGSKNTFEYRFSPGSM